jgi:molecular chaperone DnaK (HSP70)
MPVRTLRCERCGWLAAEDDMFCPGCGKQLFDLTVWPPAVMFYLDRRDPASSYERAIKVSDGGWGAPGIAYEKGPAWVSYPEEGVLRLDAGGDALKVLPKGPEKAVFQARPSSVRAEIEVSVYPPPTITVYDMTVSKGFTSGVPNRLPLEVFSPIYVESLTFEPNWFTPRPGLQSKALMGEADIPVEVNIPPSVTADTPVAYTMTVQGIKEPFRGNFQVLFSEAPQLVVKEIKERKQLPELLDGYGVFELTIQNTGGGDLWVDGIAFREKSAPQALDLVADLTCFEIKAREMPRTIQVTARPRNGLKAVRGSYFYQIVFQSNDPKSEERPLTLQVTNDTYTPWVALDYGTTDTTAAIFDENTGQFVNLLLDEWGDPRIYSNIYFQLHTPDKDPPYRWVIGQAARVLRTARQAPQRLVQAIKVRIGMHYGRRIVFEETAQENVLPAEEIAKYILQDLLTRIRRYLRKHPIHFVLCVPTRFSLRRRQALCDVFRAAAAGVGVNVELLEVVDESLAAGLYSLSLGQGAQAGQVTTALTVDFGGGTTDVTLFRVKWKAEGTPESAEIVGAWGDPNMGGEEITFQIARLLLANYQKLQRKVEAQDEDLWRALIPQAESLKLAVSEMERARRGLGAAQPESILGRLAPEGLQEIDDITKYYEIGDEKMRRVVFIDSYLKQHKIELVSKENEHIEVAPEQVIDIFTQKVTSLHQALESLLKLENLTKVDILMLAGQSSRFPVVEETLKDLAKRLEYVAGKDGKWILKECVSRGALILADARIDVKGRDRIWTTLGYWKAPTKFEVLVKWGASCSAAAGTQAVIFTLHRVKVANDVLRFELREKTNLVGDVQTELYGVFELDVAGAAQSQFPCRLSIGNDGSIKVHCDVAGEWKEMKSVDREVG